MARYTPFEMYKKDALKAAKDFDYGSEIIKKIEKARSQYEISSIMRYARTELLK